MFFKVLKQLISIFFSFILFLTSMPAYLTLIIFYNRPYQYIIVNGLVVSLHSLLSEFFSPFFSSPLPRISSHNEEIIPSYYCKHLLVCFPSTFLAYFLNVFYLNKLLKARKKCTVIIAPVLLILRKCLQRLECCNLMEILVEEVSTIR